MALIGTLLVLGHVVAEPAGLAVRLTATALVMSGTGTPLSIPDNTEQQIRDYVIETGLDFIAPSGLCIGGDPGCTLDAVYTPEQLGFLTGWHDMSFDESVAVGRANLDNCIQGAACTVTPPPYSATIQQALTDSAYVVYGLSQSSVVAGTEKAYLIAHPPGKTVSFILTANPNRPNGGLSERFVGMRIPIIGLTFNGATQTNSPEPTPLLTEDLARQYDGWADFPTNPLNVLADINAVMGMLFLHSHHLDVDATAWRLQGRFQDTTYYLAPTPVLPLLIPLARIPIVGMPLALALDPPLRVLVETGYDRTINPGLPTPAQWLYTPNPIKAVADLVRSVPTGWDDSIAYMAGDPARRPFHTAPQPVYGVGGPPVDAGSVDPYGPVPRELKMVAAQSDPPITASPVRQREQRSTARRAESVRPARNARPARAYSPSVKIATARVQPADAA